MLVQLLHWSSPGRQFVTSSQSATSDPAGNSPPRPESWQRQPRPLDITVGLHTQIVADFLKDSTRCAVWFFHFRQRSDLGSKEIFLLQKTSVLDGEACAMDALSCKTWVLIRRKSRGMTMWTEAESRR
uniref:Uncharacterized protein n=1 Tax=Hyaloperonospora arabidopsidis (strain Emoy2) TaxID=559515 RepID=M4B4W6_HYAAE